VLDARVAKTKGADQYNAAVQQIYIRRWFTMLRVGRELARGHFCTVTPP
jgi:hypothetical protein